MACSVPLRLLEQFPRRKWEPRSGAVPTDALHWGQRKLLLTETAFLTQHARAGDTVLYVGAAPGEHILLLACSLFSHLKFHCVDPRPMAFPPQKEQGTNTTEMEDDSPLVRATVNNVTQETAFFTAADAQRWRGKAQLVISDLRNTQDEQGVKDDMELQELVVRTVQPRAALLKFRLPWGAGKTQYLSGDVHLQPYAQGRSTETRLWVTDCSAKREWDHEEYEDRLFWFNTQLRSQFRPPSGAPLSLSGGLPAAWDGWAEGAIWQAYLDSQHVSLANSSEHASAQGLVARASAPAAAAAPGGGAASLVWAATSLLCCFKAADSNRATWLSRAQAQRKRPRSPPEQAQTGGAARGDSSNARCWLCQLQQEASGTT